MSFGASGFGSRPLGGGASGATPGTLRLFIAGVDATELLAFGSLKGRQTLNARGTASCRLNSLDDPFVPEAGHRFTIKLDTTVLFDGYVHSAARRYLTHAHEAKYEYRLSVVDWNGLLDRRLVNQVYAQQTAGAIVRDILATILAGEGLTAGTIADGPVVAKAVFPLVKASDALRELSDITGLQWRVDEYKALHFFDASTFPTPFALDTSNALYADLKRDLSLDQYANRVYVRAGHGITAAQTERQKGDGDKTTFVMPFPLADAPTILRESPGGVQVAQTVGVRQVDVGRQWYWQKDSAEITADTTTTIMGAGEVLIVTFQGLYPLVLVIDNPGEIAVRQAADGGSGIHEMIHDEQSVDGEEVVEGLSQGLLRKFGALPDRLTFTTYTDRLYPGHALQAVVPLLGLTGAYIVTDVAFAWLTDRDGRAFLRYDVECAPAAKYDGMVEYFSALRRAAAPLVIRENEVLAQPVVGNEPVALTDSVDASLVVTSGVGKWDGTTRWGSSQWG